MLFPFAIRFHLIHLFKFSAICSASVILISCKDISSFSFSTGGIVILIKPSLPVLAPDDSRTVYWGTLRSGYAKM